MRLIDADTLLKMLANGLLEPTGRAVPFNAGIAFAVSMVRYAPTIDAVPRYSLLLKLEKVIKNGGGVLDVYDTIKYYGGQHDDE